MSERQDLPFSPATHPAEYYDIRTQLGDLANRTRRRGLVHVAFTLEMALVLLEDAGGPYLPPDSGSV